MKMMMMAVRRRCTDADAPAGSLMYEMHWDELPLVGYVVMKFQDFRKAVQLQKMRQNGKAMIEILITRPDEYHLIGDGRLDEGLVPIAEPMGPDAEVAPSWYVRDRLRNYSGRYVVVMVDLRVHWQIGGDCSCGSSSIKVAGICILALVFPFRLLFSGVWEALIFGTGDWFDFGEPFFVARLPQLTLCLGTGSCPNHRRFQRVPPHSPYAPPNDKLFLLSWSISPTQKNSNMPFHASLLRMLEACDSSAWAHAFF